MIEGGACVSELSINANKSAAELQESCILSRLKHQMRGFTMASYKIQTIFRIFITDVDREFMARQKILPKIDGFTVESLDETAARILDVEK